MRKLIILNNGTSHCSEETTNSERVLFWGVARLAQSLVSPSCWKMPHPDPGGPQV